MDDATLELIVKPYLERIYELRGDDPQNIGETELQMLMVEAKLLRQVSEIVCLRLYNVACSEHDLCINLSLHHLIWHL